MSDSNKLTAAQLESEMLAQLAALSDTAELLAERRLEEGALDGVRDLWNEDRKSVKLWKLRETLRLALKWGF